MKRPAFYVNNSLINHLHREGKVKDLKLVVVENCVL
jgi:hypothetical protein